MDLTDQPEAKKPLAKNVDLDALAAKSAGSSGADLANILNEAAIIAARLNHHEISNDDITDSTDSRLEYTVTKDGIYYLVVTDAHDQGGPAHVYRLSMKVG